MVEKYIIILIESEHFRNTELENQVEELNETIKQKDIEIQSLKEPNKR